MNTYVPTTERPKLLVLSSTTRVVIWYGASRVVVMAVLLDVVGFHGLGHALSVWDGQWYLYIARFGYPHAGTLASFFPLFPLTVRSIASVTGHHWVQTSFVVSTLAGLGACIAVARLVADLRGEQAGYRAGVLMAVAPGSFYLSAAYPDGLAIAISAVCLLALARRQWLAAGLVAAVATATSPLAVFLIVVATVAASRAHDRRAWVAPVIAPAGVVAYFSYLWVYFGTPFAWWDAERTGWRQGFDPLAWAKVLRTSAATIEVLSIAMVLIGIVAMWRSRVPLAWWLFTLLIVASVLLDRGSILEPRLTMDAFGVTAAVGIWTSPRWLPRIAVASGVFMVVGTIHPWL